MASAPALAADQSDIEFTDGSAIIHCAAPSKEASISTEIFNEAFPQWITNLQIYANEGIVARAHYLSELKRGIFIVVLGDDAEQAMERAVAIQQENQNILKAAITKAGGDTSVVTDGICQIIPIGPLAITSLKK